MKPTLLSVAAVLFTLTPARAADAPNVVVIFTDDRA